MRWTYEINQLYAVDILSPKPVFYWRTPSFKSSVLERGVDSYVEQFQIKLWKSFETHGLRDTLRRGGYGVIESLINGYSTEINAGTIGGI